jgi:hypothetical protein
VTPTGYGRSPYSRPPGSLAETLRPSFDGVDKNFELVQASITSIIAYLKKSIPNDLSTTLTALGIKSSTVKKFTASAGGTTWNPADYAGFTNVVIDPNGETNTLKLPVLGTDGRMLLTVKCLLGGNVLLDAGTADIVAASGGVSPLSIPYAFVADGVNITTYAVTMVWDGTNWQIIDTAILVA